MKKTIIPNQNQKSPKPAFKWQRDEYTRYAKFSLVLPSQFLLLCRLMDITPEQMLIDFMDNLSHGSWKRLGRDKAKEHLVNYFAAHGYGQHHYTEAEIRDIFKEMDAMGMLFPANGSNKLIDRYSKWKRKQHAYLFKQWWHKPRRRPAEDL